MWNDKIRDRYWWASIRNGLDELICELNKAEEEEAALLFLLGLHLSDVPDLEFFDEKEQAKITGLLALLIEFANQHSSLLVQAIQRLEERREYNARATA